jgi:CBS domain-containing protein
LIVTSVAQLIGDRPLAEIPPQASVREACEVMCRLDARAVVVVEDRRVVGVLSERDVVRKIVCAGRDVADTLAVDVMTPSPQTIEAGSELARALEVMSSGGFHHVPVVDAGEPVGLLSADDVPEEYRMLLERFREMRGG